MTLKEFLSSLGTLNVQVIIKDYEGTMIAKIYSKAIDSLDETLCNEIIDKWSIVRTTLITVNLKGEEEPSEETIAVESVEFNINSVELAVNDTVELVATVLPENATNKEIIWDVADGEIVSVENGIITALSEGSTTITVTTIDGGFTAVCEVIVNSNE